MDDKKIVQLYWERNQDAIMVTDQKYGKYCSSIAHRILDSMEDAEECVNDTYFNAWNSMPPHKPSVLSAFLGKITRNLSYNRVKYYHAEKRGGSQVPLALEELGDCVSGFNDVEQEIDRMELTACINDFLKKLSREKRVMFVRRYWYFDSVGEIAVRLKVSENVVSVTLNRVRQGLRDYLAERGFHL